MAIIVNGFSHRSLRQPLYVNGQQVKEAFVNGIKVYPDTNRQFLWIHGHNTFSIKWEIYSEPEDKNETDNGFVRFWAAATYWAILDVGTVDDNPEYSLVDISTDDPNSPKTGLYAPGISDPKVVDSAVTLTVGPTRTASNLVTNFYEIIGGYWVSREWQMPLGMINAFNGYHTHSEGGSDSLLFKIRAREAVGKTISPYYNVNGRTIEVPEDEFDTSIAYAALLFDDESSIIEGISINVPELLDFRTMELYGYTLRTRYDVRKRSQKLKVGIQSFSESNLDESSLGVSDNV